jgi:hypothetical protein
MSEINGFDRTRHDMARKTAQLQDDHRRGREAEVSHPGEGVGHWEPWFPAYSFLNQAAAEAREESRRFWFDKPSFPTPGWFKR